MSVQAQVAASVTAALLVAAFGAGLILATNTAKVADKFANLYRGHRWLSKPWYDQPIYHRGVGIVMMVLAGAGLIATVVALHKSGVP